MEVGRDAGEVKSYRQAEMRVDETTTELRLDETLYRALFLRQDFADLLVKSRLSHRTQIDEGK